MFMFAAQKVKGQGHESQNSAGVGLCKIVRYSLDQNKKIGCLSNCCYCSDCSQNLPGPAPNIWLTMFQISSKSVYFLRSY